MLVTARRNSSDFASRVNPAPPSAVRASGSSDVDTTGAVTLGFCLRMANLTMTPSFGVSVCRGEDQTDQEPPLRASVALPLSYSGRDLRRDSNPRPTDRMEPGPSHRLERDALGDPRRGPGE